METLCNFIESNGDIARFRAKLEESYYFREFDSDKDFNLEFIFRQLPTVFNVSESERIGSVSRFVCAGSAVLASSRLTRYIQRAFYKLYPQVATLIPMTNAERSAIKASAGTIEELLANDPVAVEVRDEMSFQKKIMPWEMMLESDIDLTKSLARHNVSVERSN